MNFRVPGSGNLWRGCWLGCSRFWRRGCCHGLRACASCESHAPLVPAVLFCRFASLSTWTPAASLLPDLDFTTPQSFVQVGSAYGTLLSSVGCRTLNLVGIAQSLSPPLSQSCNLVKLPHPVVWVSAEPSVVVIRGVITIVICIWTVVDAIRVNHFSRVTWRLGFRSAAPRPELSFSTTYPLVLWFLHNLLFFFYNIIWTDIVCTIWFNSRINRSAVGRINCSVFGRGTVRTIVGCPLLADDVLCLCAFSLYKDQGHAEKG